MSDDKPAATTKVTAPSSEQAEAAKPAGATDSKAPQAPATSNQ